ncbi:MAG TPA: sigma 54-interacting transcriptional regulator [Acidobacteriaceae bacterium]
MAALHRMPALSSIYPVATLETNRKPLSPALWLSGSSAVITQLRSQIHRIAPHFRTALLTGERGCGEVAAAHILHQLSPRSQYPFVELTPASTELRFGAQRRTTSVTTEGMFYLPRPERLSPEAQAALLRLLRERGSQAPRIVAFAERGLRPLVATNGFSAELADSLGALRISLPSLRERSADIPELLTQLLRDFASASGTTPPQLAPDLLDAARDLPWPGNFLQLQSTVEGLLQHADMQHADMDHTDQPVLHAADLQSVLGAVAPAPPVDRSEIRMIPLDDVIQEHIRAVLLACNGNKLRTADILRISRSTLYRMLEAQAAPATPPHSLENLQMQG